MNSNTFSGKASITIWFDGYCDGMTFEGAPPLWGTQVGCASNPVIGDVANLAFPYATTGATIQNENGASMWTTYLWGDYTWSNWYTDGSAPPIMFNSGTWSKEKSDGGDRASFDLK